MKSIALVLLVFGGCSAFSTEDCLSLCKDSNPIDEWEEEGYAPNKDALETLCPKTLEFLDCRMREMQFCLGQRFEELAVSTNLSTAAFSRVILATDKLIRQICNENSPFHRDYVRNIDCFKAFYYVIKQLCAKDSRRLENRFLGTLMFSSEEDIACKVKLFSGPYELACTADMIGRACGAPTKRLYTTAALMFKDIFLVDCTRVNQDWKEEYVNFLLRNKKKELEEIYDAFFRKF